MNNKTITVITNNQPRPLLCWYDLPESARADFDYVEESDYYSTRFVRYKGCWYDVFDTERSVLTFPQWDSYISDSFFSGVVFKFTNDYDYVIVGCYYA